jgi:hypothetical protein
MGLPIKEYAVVLAVMSVAAFAAGSWINYDYARKNPASDPYIPRSRIIILTEPTDLSKVDPRQRTLPPEVSVIPHGPGFYPSDVYGIPVNAGRNMHSRNVSSYTKHSIENTIDEDCTDTDTKNAQITAGTDCKASGGIGQTSSGAMTIGAGSVKVVPPK